MKIKSHFVLSEGRMGNTLFMKEAIKKIKLPKSVPILDNWDKTRVIGHATNFKRVKNAIVCDGEITDKDMIDKIAKGVISSIAPGVKLNCITSGGEEIAKDLELETLSTTNEPADERNRVNIQDIACGCDDCKQREEEEIKEGLKHIDEYCYNFSIDRFGDVRCLCRSKGGRLL